jgi:branched-chain amino acid transport system substrate-binding protein
MIKIKRAARPGRVWAAVAAAGVLGLAGCGGSSPHGQASSGSTGGSSTGGPPITIGVLEPLSGGFSGPGQDGVNAVKLAADEINASGGIRALGGRQLKVVAVDSTTDNATSATSAATQLLQSNPAFVVGPFVSAVALPASTVFERAKVPECVGSFSDQLTSRGYQYLFELPPTASTIAKAAVSSFTDVVSTVAPNATKVAAVYDSNPGEAVVSSFAKDLGAAGKFQVALNLQYPAGLTNAGPVAQKIQSSGAQILVPGATTPELEQILGSLSSLGEGQIAIFNPGGGAPATTEYGKSLKSLVDGQFVLPTWDYDMNLSPAQNALLAKANSDYVKAYPSQPFMGQFAGEDYTCTQVMVAAMENAKSADPTAIRNALVNTTFSSGPASLMPPGRVHFNSAGLNDAAIPLVSEWCNGTMQVVAPSNLAATTPKSAAACGRS